MPWKRGKLGTLLRSDDPIRSGHEKEFFNVAAQQLAVGGVSGWVYWHV
jgi:hypothetical protein